MQHCRCYFLSERGSIATIEPVGWLGDEELSRAAASLFRPRLQYHGIYAIEYAIEAWDEERRVLYRPATPPEQAAAFNRGERL